MRTAWPDAGSCRCPSRSRSSTSSASAASSPRPSSTPRRLSCSNACDRGGVTRESCDVVVVGGGAMGSAAAWWLARRGRHVVLLERFEQGHTRGSSHGGSRVFRLDYPDSASCLADPPPPAR